jgi:FkbM family methyltransferase
VDATFDFALVDQFHCNVFSFDPTPASISYMEQMKYDRSKLHFFPIGIWDEDAELRFYMPANKDETLLSVFDLQGTGKYVVCKCKKLSTIMRELKHNRIDLLKIDIEGAWRKVIKNIADENISISILCVELDSPTTLARVFWVIRTLRGIGLELAHFEKDNYLFVQKALLP